MAADWNGASDSTSGHTSSRPAHNERCAQPATSTVEPPGSVAASPNSDDLIAVENWPGCHRRSVRYRTGSRSGIQARAGRRAARDSRRVSVIDPARTRAAAEAYRRTCRQRLAGRLSKASDRNRDQEDDDQGGSRPKPATRARGAPELGVRTLVCVGWERWVSGLLGILHRIELCGHDCRSAAFTLTFATMRAWSRPSPG